jgi:K+-sensing histidine kinase KdpD
VSRSGAGRHYVERLRQDAHRYGRELLDENRRLRDLVLAIQTEAHRLREQLQATKAEAERNTREHADLQQRLCEVQSESRRFAQQFEAIERQNTNLANLYVASYQLAGTLDRERVLQVIQEILANLVGSEETAIFELEPATGLLRLVASNGIDPQPFVRVAKGEGIIGQVAATGETWIAGENGDTDGPERHLSACMPLKLEDRVTGAIALFRLLPQKAALEPLDRELFDLLATHAAMALYCTALYDQVRA